MISSVCQLWPGFLFSRFLIWEQPGVVSQTFKHWTQRRGAELLALGIHHDNNQQLEVTRPLHLVLGDTISQNSIAILDQLPNATWISSRAVCLDFFLRGPFLDIDICISPTDPIRLHGTSRDRRRPGLPRGSFEMLTNVLRPSRLSGLMTTILAKRRFLIALGIPLMILCKCFLTCVHHGQSPD